MLKNTATLAVAGALALSLGGCASTGPAAPTVSVMPAKGKSYETFMRDDDFCQMNAQRMVGYESPGAASKSSAVPSAAVGTPQGALAGAAIGSSSANMGKGAAIGAGSGLVLGSLIGAGQGREAGGNVQARFDMAYAQCMSARGHDVIGNMRPQREVVIVERREPVFMQPYPVYGAPRPYYRRPHYY